MCGHASTITRALCVKKKSLQYQEITLLTCNFFFIINLLLLFSLIFYISKYFEKIALIHTFIPTTSHWFSLFLVDSKTFWRSFHSKRGWLNHGTVSPTAWPNQAIVGFDRPHPGVQYIQKLRWRKSWIFCEARFNMRIFSFAGLIQRDLWSPLRPGKIRGYCLSQY